MDPIAIVGMSGRFPGAPDLEAFWENLRSGVESIARFSAADLAASGVPAEVIDRPDYVNARGIVDGIELFDPAFFGMTPRTAALLNPQHRLFLEAAWTALEDAGYDPFRYPGAISVYAGCGSNHYGGNEQNVGREFDRMEMLLGNDKDTLALQTAYRLDLKGAAVSVQTTCSTSLVAVVLASRALNAGDCDMALAGGVKLDVPHRVGYRYAAGGIHSSDGHCRAFDAGANGTVSGNGCGVVLLKRLGDAQADGDRIHAVIAGAAINNDGAAKVGFTAPSVAGQADVIARAHKSAGITAESISYVECHGTGTRLGDPIEIAGLSAAFADRGRRSCPIGSLKTNIGHLDAAAGIAGLLKTVLALKAREIPPSLHYAAPNPELQLDRTPFVVNAVLRPWPGGAEPRRAGVSSFGMGGTNAHVVLQEAPVSAVSAEVHEHSPRPHELIVLSSKTPAALEAATRRLEAHLSNHPTLELADVAFTLQLGRRAFPYRRAAVLSRQGHLHASVENELRRGETGRCDGEAPPIIFLLAGGPGFDEAPGRSLYEHEPAFRSPFEKAAKIVRDASGLDLVGFLYGERSKVVADRPIDYEVAQQLAKIAIGYGVCELLMAWQLRPAAIVGMGIGKLIGACVAGVLRPEDLARIALGSDVRRACESIDYRVPAIPLIDAATGVSITLNAPIAEESWSSRERETAIDTTKIRSIDEDGIVVCIGSRLDAGAEDDPSGAPPLRNWNPRECEIADAESLWRTVGRLWVAGCDVDWRAVHAGASRRRVALPTYPFERLSCWIEPIKAGVNGDSSTSISGSSSVAASAPKAPHSEPVASPTASEAMVERAICGIWESVLGVQAVKPEDDFFALGGESLTVLQVATRIQEQLGIEVPVDCLFESVNARALSRRVFDMIAVGRGG